MDRTPSVRGSPTPSVRPPSPTSSSPWATATPGVCTGSPTPAAAHQGARLTHTFSAAAFADVKLAVGNGNDWGVYRQAVAVGGPSGAAPSTDPCGTLSPDESAGLIAAARKGV